MTCKTQSVYPFLEYRLFYAFAWKSFFIAEGGRI